MQPMGRKPIRFPSKVDNHLGKGVLNWWEVCREIIKKSERQKSSREIAQELTQPN